MSKPAGNEVKRGQTIAFRIPSDTPDHVLKQLQKLKQTEKRNFSSCISEFVLQGVSQSMAKERETITIPLPKSLSKIQRDWLKHEHSEALLGNIIYQLITNPVRTASLMASLNSNSTDIDEALYLQEERKLPSAERSMVPLEDSESESGIPHRDDFLGEDDDLDDLSWENMRPSEPEATENEEDSKDDIESLLGDFLAHMNK